MKKRFSLFSLMILVTLVAISLGVYQWNKPQPIVFQVSALVEVGSGSPYSVSAWVYAVPIPKLDPNQAQLYKAMKWSKFKFPNVKEADPQKQYYTWYPVELLDGDKGEKAFICHTNDYNIAKMR